MLQELARTHTNGFISSEWSNSQYCHLYGDVWNILLCLCRTEALYSCPTGSRLSAQEANADASALTARQQGHDNAGAGQITLLGIQDWTQHP